MLAAVLKIMEIVQFKNGKYGIRRRTWLEKLFNKGGSFKDFKPILKKWRKPDDKFFHDCQTESLDEIKEWLIKTKNEYVDKVL